MGAWCMGAWVYGCMSVWVVWNGHGHGHGQQRPCTCACHARHAQRHLDQHVLIPHDAPQRGFLPIKVASEALGELHAG